MERNVLLYSVWNTDEGSFLSAQPRHTSKTNSFSIAPVWILVSYLFAAKRYCYKVKYLEVLRITSSSDGCNHFTKKGISKRGFTHWCHCLFPQIPYISNLPQSNNTNNHLLWPWFYGPLRDLASLTTDAHSSLSTAFCRQLLTFISHRSFSTSSSHLNLTFPLLLLSSDLLSYTYLTHSLP